MTMTITKENFDVEVMKSDKPVLVDFWATWCPPCKMLGPVVEEFSNRYPEYKVCKIDVDAQPELAAKFSVMNIPTLLVFKNGDIVNRHTGFAPKEQLLELMK